MQLAPCQGPFSVWLLATHGVNTKSERRSSSVVTLNFLRGFSTSVQPSGGLMGGCAGCHISSAIQLVFWEVSEATAAQ